MTLYRFVEVLCDGCGEGSDFAEPTGRLVRADARSAGWRVGLPGGVDLCPECRPRAAAYLAALGQA